jgi:hypothetical protein
MSASIAFSTAASRSADAGPMLTPVLAPMLSQHWKSRKSHGV